MNTCLLVMGLLAGGGDLEKTLCMTLMGGYDTDSTCATAGSIIGMMTGAKALPEKWIAPLNDTLESMVMGFGHCKISELAGRTIKFAPGR
jgi:ADP-ribosylglycohydrolase